MIRNLLFTKKSQQVESNPDQYTLTTESRTSAGVYKDGNLVRTLWNNTVQAAGTYNKPTFDGNDDNGSPIALPYTIRVKSHNMSYNWTANIGNTSSETEGDNKIRALRSLWDMVEVGDYIVGCSGFVEGNTPTFKFAKTNINYMIPVQPASNHDVLWETNYLDIDTSTNILYLIGFDSYKNVGDTPSNADCLIYAIDMDTETDHSFSSGTTKKPSLADRTYSCCGVVENDVDARGTGIAVSSTRNFLYSTHIAKNWLRIYNKTTGALLTTQTLSLKDIAIEGDTLWGINGTNVVKYNINTSTGELTASGVSISMTNPIRVSVRSGLVIVIEHGTQQVKAYNTSGVLQWTLGQSGGYTNAPYAANDKFHFYDYNDLIPKSFICQVSDGSFWIGDNGNNRYLRFDSTRIYQEYFSYFCMNYNSAVNINDPYRCFAGFLEYNTVTGAFVANWEANLWSHSPTSDYFFVDRRLIFRNCWDVDGRTFATIDNYSGGDRTPEIVELTSTGIRLTGILFDAYSTDIVEENGDIISFPYTEATSGTQALTRRAYNGLDGSNNPTWLSPTTIANIPISNSLPTRATTARPSSRATFFQPSWEYGGRHFGRYVGGNWLWLVAPSTSQSYTGNFPTDGTFDCGNGIPSFGGYAGWEKYECDGLDIFNYIGEGWKNNQTNIWQIWEDGLLLMIVGKTGPQAEADSGTDNAPAEAAGVVISGRVVKIGSNIYIIHSDESRHGALHRFVISNKASIVNHDFLIES